MKNGLVQFIRMDGFIRQMWVNRKIKFLSGTDNIYVSWC